MKTTTPKKKKRAEAEIDHIFANAFGNSEEERLFLAQIVTAARQGHLCFHRKEPLCSPLIEEVNETVEWFEKLIGKWGDWYYLQRNWVIEARVAKELKRLFNRPPLKEPLELKKSSSLNAEQLKAAKKGLSENFVAITGGPGTGKTYLIGQLITTFLAASEGNVMLAAPTGKAVGQLKMRLKSEREQFSERIEIKTVHALLNIKKSEDLVWSEKEIKAPLLIIDECSMIDASLFAALLKAVSDQTRVILIGDQDQLPPVEAGTLFGQICHHLSTHRPSLYAELKKKERTKELKLLAAASALRSSRLPPDLPLQSKLPLDQWAKRFPKPQAKKPDAKALFEQLKAFRVLSCLRQGSAGVEALNEAISKRVRASFRSGEIWPVPILMTKSDRELGIFNGDLALLIKRSNLPYLEEKEIAIFETESGYQEILAALLPPFEFAYCLSVHKSQGSEYDEVALVIPPGSEAFGREILYTGVTRARTKVTLFGDKAVVNSCLSHASQRDSGLARRLSF